MLLADFSACVAHEDASFWVDVQDPASQSPMAHRMALIRTTYDKLKVTTGRLQPEIKGAGLVIPRDVANWYSYITGREVMAQALLGCDHVTVLPESLRDLTSFDKMPEYTKNERTERIYLRADQQAHTSPWKQPTQSEIAAHLESLLTQADSLLDGSPAVEVDLGKNYLVDNVLDQHNMSDKATAFRLEDAIGTFKRYEHEVFQFLAGIQAEIANV
jgi:hypothetical protein